MVGDPDNIIIPDGDYPLEDGPSRKKAKAVPVKKTAVKRTDAPRDRGSDPARRPGAYEQARKSDKGSENWQHQELMGESGLAGPYDASSYAKHSRKESNNKNSPTLKPKEGKYKKTPEGPANGGKHGKSWNGKD